MRYHRNKGGMYAAGFGLLGLLVTVGIMLYLYSIWGTATVNSYNQSEKTLDKALELGKQVSNQAYHANRDLSGQANGAAPTPAPAPAQQTGGAPISPVAPGIVTPMTGDQQPTIPPAKKIVGNTPREMPDHGAGDLMKEMEGK